MFAAIKNVFNQLISEKQPSYYDFYRIVRKGSPVELEAALNKWGLQGISPSQRASIMQHVIVIQQSPEKVVLLLKYGVDPGKTGGRLVPIITNVAELSRSCDPILLVLLLTYGTATYKKMNESIIQKQFIAEHVPESRYKKTCALLRKDYAEAEETYHLATEETQDSKQYALYRSASRKFQEVIEQLSQLHDSEHKKAASLPDSEHPLKSHHAHTLYLGLYEARIRVCREKQAICETAISTIDSGHETDTSEDSTYAATTARTSTFFQQDSPTLRQRKGYHLTDDNDCEPLLLPLAKSTPK